MIREFAQHPKDIHQANVICSLPPQGAEVLTFTSANYFAVEGETASLTAAVTSAVSGFQTP